MDTIELLNNPEIQELIADYKYNKVKKGDVAYNLFTISSYNSYLENFHSDIIASLLDPNALHYQSYKFIELFIQFLNNSHQLSIDVNNFKNIKVTREKGNIDIWIKDENSRQSIIIENKINNAPDMEDQIERYYQFVVKENYKVVAIVYLSLDGFKLAPSANMDIKNLIFNIGAFTNKASDLVNGWLEPCLEVADNRASQSVLFQYINLIKHLANKNMDNKVIERFYQFLSINEGLDTAKAIVEMYNSITTYRAAKFKDALPDISPFKKPYLLRPNYWLFENNLDGISNFKLDVWFNIDGSATMVFWDFKNKGEIGRLESAKKLKTINAIHEFANTASFNGSGFTREFKIGDAYKTMLEVDEAVIFYTQDFFNKLKESANHLTISK